MNNFGQTTIPPVVDVTTLVSAIVGVFLPLLIAWLRSRYSSSRYGAGLAFGVCLVTALLITFLLKGFQGTWQRPWAHYWYDNTILVCLNIGAVLVTAWNFYARLWQPLGVIAKLEGSGLALGDPRRNTTPPVRNGIS